MSESGISLICEWFDLCTVVMLTSWQSHHTGGGTPLWLSCGLVALWREGYLSGTSGLKD